VRLHPNHNDASNCLCIYFQARAFRPLYKSIVELEGWSDLLLGYVLNVSVKLSILILKLCVADTANLIIHMLSVDPKWVHPLPMDVPTLVPGSGGVTVTLIDANHCRISFIISCESYAYLLKKVQAHRCFFSRGHRQLMLVIVLTSRVMWAQAEFFGTSTVATSGRLLNTPSTKPLRGNESTLYI
jgi:hypothetical protein